MSDGTGFYLIAKSSSLTSPLIYKWSNSETTQVKSQTITNFKEYAFGQYMLSDSELFFFGIDSLSDLHFYKVTFGNTDVDWAYKLTCPSSLCVLRPSESQLSSDNSKLYIITAYGNPKNLYFLELMVSDGSKVGSWYKSNQSEFAGVSGSAIMGDYIAASIVLSSTTTTYNLVLQNLISSEFKIYTFSGTIIYGLWVDAYSERYYSLISFIFWKLYFTLDSHK